MLSETQSQLLKNFANLSDQLFDYGVISTDSFTGEIGEYYACQLINLDKTKRVTRAVDAIGKDGKRYQVKSKVVSGSFNYSIKKLETNLFDYLIVVYFDRSYSLLKVLKIESGRIKDSQISITQSNLTTFEATLNKTLINSSKVQQTIQLFAESYLDLEKNGIIRSRRIVGDLGEFYAASKLNLTLSTLKNEKGIDARDSTVLTYEIKTRRVYSSGRRISETRRINNLVGKHADYIVVVTLDRCFQCSGMWIMPTKNIVNPKQAKLQIVNTTPGTYTVVPSSIPWLSNRTEYIGFNKIVKEKIAKQNPKFLFTPVEEKREKVKIVKRKPKPVVQTVNTGFSWELLIITLIILFVAIVMMTT